MCFFYDNFIISIHAFSFIIQINYAEFCHYEALQRVSYVDISSLVLSFTILYYL